MSERIPREQADIPLMTRQLTAYQQLVLRTIPPAQEDEEGTKAARQVRLSLLALGLSCHASRLSDALLGSALYRQASCLDDNEVREAVRYHLGNILWHLTAIFALKRLALGEFYRHGQGAPDDGRQGHRAVLESANDPIHRLHLLAGFLVEPPFSTLDSLLRASNRDRKDVWIVNGIRMIGVVRICADAFDLSLQEIMEYNLQVLKGEREVGGSPYFQQDVLGAEEGLPQNC